MEDTDSSDFLSSCDSLYSADSTAVSGGEDTSYVDFNVFLSGGLEEATKAKQDLDNEIMIPNSRLSSSDHPVLIRLENEYQARRSHWHHRSGRYFGYEQEIAGRISYSSQTALTCRGAKLGSRNGDEPLKHCVCHEEANHGSPHGLKRQRTQEAALPTEWWKDRQQQDCAVSEGDRIFAQKCQELQGFIKPLTDLLNGLKKGRYERGLSTFQQSVAMDRIQRIIGVLQKPQMGERYLGTLLQVEMMLKIWFPSVTSSSSASSSSDCEMEEPQYKVAKHPNVDRSDATSCPSSEGHSPNSHAEENPVPSPAVTHLHSDCVCCKDQTHIQTPMNLTWMHPTPVANPSLGHVDLNHLNRAFGQEIFGLNTNNCGVILFLHSNPASSSTSPRPASTMQTENPPPAIRRHGGAEVTKDKEPPRSRSAPATLPASGRSGLRDTGSLSCSLSHILVCSPRPVGENT